MTYGCYEAVYAEFEWDNANVSFPSMTYNYLSVNHRNGPSASLHLPVHGRRGYQPLGQGEGHQCREEHQRLCDHLGLKGEDEDSESHSLVRIEQAVLTRRAIRRRGQAASAGATP